ncbi:hypothetical protein E1B28_003655 [Marasmius oreades]|uniref:Uncharacterized protein n=1 Tax=Marasmius oreades TaxID=181124 RepID=A0A9P7UX16_9AGAR|nr:uncharacterized protein E1B28_003655 [Marasmius oreades]KAG7096204.1 hypothetical protein E1B28_003655 [Marasmius oreades]
MIAKRVSLLVLDCFESIGCRRVQNRQADSGISRITKRTTYQRSALCHPSPPAGVASGIVPRSRGSVRWDETNKYGFVAGRLRVLRPPLCLLVTSFSIPWTFFTQRLSTNFLFQATGYLAIHACRRQFLPNQRCLCKFTPTPLLPFYTFIRPPAPGSAG